VQVVAPGEIGTGTFRYSTDGGKTWVNGGVIPGTFVIPGGVTLAFTNGTAPSFIIGDILTVFLGDAILQRGADAETPAAFGERCSNRLGGRPARQRSPPAASLPLPLVARRLAVRRQRRAPAVHVLHRHHRAGPRAGEPGARPAALNASVDQEHARSKTNGVHRKQSDIARIYSKLEQPFAAIFAVGARAGLRPGEILSLEWGEVDLGARRLLVQRQVRHGRVGPTKSGKPRVVPIIEPLAKILAEWKLATGGEGALFKPLNPWRHRSKFIKDASVREAIRGALKKCGLPEAWTWYTVSRHTYASQHVMGGGSLATRREILGHSSVTVTERYAHLNPGLFKAEDLLKLSVTMSREDGELIDLADHRPKGGAAGHVLGTAAVDDPAAEGVSTDGR
jgi:integrase